jgi:hypothetical protein
MISQSPSSAYLQPAGERLGATRSKPVPLAAGGLAALLLTAILLTGNALTQSSAISHSAGSEASELARTLADRLDRRMLTLARKASLLARIAPLSHVWHGEPDAIRGMLEQVRAADNYVTWIGFARPDGAVKASTGALREGDMVAERRWFRHGLEGSATGYLQEAAVPGHWPSGESFRFVETGLPLRSEDGALIGVLGVTLSWAWVADLRSAALSSPQREAATEIWILSNTGQVLVGPNSGQKLYSAGKIAEMIRNRSGSFAEGPAESRKLTGFAVTRGLNEADGPGWIIVVRRPG